MNPKHPCRFRNGSHLAAVFLVLLLAAFNVVGCATGSRPEPAAANAATEVGVAAATAAATPTIVTAATATAAMATPTPLLPVTVEVTRVVTQEIVVTATPAPPVACAGAGSVTATEAIIGVLAPFSQDAAWPKALDMQAGIGLAVEDINLAGGMAGRPLRVSIEDTAGDPAQAARLAEKLIVEECASALVGGFTLEESMAIREVSERFGVPFLIVEATADELTSDSPRTVFRLAPTASMVAQMPVGWLKGLGDYNADGLQQVTLIVENTPAGDQALEQTIQVFTAGNVTYEFLRVDADAQDYSPQIARIVASERAPDALFLYLAGDATLTALRQLLDAGIGPQKGTLLVAGRSALDGATFWQQIPDGAFTVVSRRGPWYTSLTPMGQAVAERLRQYSTEWPEPVAFAAYDALHLLADAGRRTNSLAPADLLGALETTDVTLASGYYYFPYNSQRPPSGPLEPAYLWHQWPEPPLLYLQYREPLQDPATIDVIWPPRYHTVEGPALRP